MPSTTSDLPDFPLHIIPYMKYKELQLPKFNVPNRVKLSNSQKGLKTLQRKNGKPSKRYCRILSQKIIENIAEINDSDIPASIQIIT
jgi:hypothetical protein